MRPRMLIHIYHWCLFAVHKNAFKIIGSELVYVANGCQSCSLQPSLIFQCQISCNAQTANACWCNKQVDDLPIQRTNYTVDSEILAKVLFSRNFADAEFRENKP